MGSRAWIKIYCDKLLISDDIGADLSALGAWIKLLCIAGSSSWGDIGVIQLREFMGLSDKQIADIMGISTRQWRRYKDIFVRQGQITVVEKNVIIINNWDKYQSEYGRQKGYRQGYKLKLQEQSRQNCNPELQPEKLEVKKRKRSKEEKQPKPVDNFSSEDNNLEHIGQIIVKKIKPEKPKP